MASLSSSMGAATHNMTKHTTRRRMAILFSVLASAMILYSVGFVTTSWSCKDNKHSGLWQECAAGERPQGSNWLISARVFASLGLVAVAVAFILITIYMIDGVLQKSIVSLFLALISLTAGVFIIVSVTVYGVHSNPKGKLSWSFYSALLSGLLCIQAGIVSVVQMCRSKVCQ